MGWQKISFSVDDILAKKNTSLMGEFDKALLVLGDPWTVAMFSSDRDDGGEDVYFTPDCESKISHILLKYGAVECDKPIGNVALSVGQDKSRELLK